MHSHAFTSTNRTAHMNQSPPRTASRFHPRQTVVLVPDTRYGRSLAIARHASNVSAGHSICISLLSHSYTPTDTRRHSQTPTNTHADSVNKPSRWITYSPPRPSSSRQVIKSPSHQVTEEHVLVPIAVCHRRLKSTTHRHSLNSSSPGYTHHSITLAHTAL